MYTYKFTPDIPSPYGYVYVTTNLLTGKRYCGKHKSSSFDVSYLGSGLLLKQDITQYGVKHFKSAPIDWAASAEELHQKEVNWIQRLNAVNSNDWYNIIEDSNRYIETKTDTVIRFPSEPEFVKLYVKDILYLSDMPQACNKVLLSLLAKAKYADKTTINSTDSGGLIVSMSGYDRKQLMQETGFTRMSSFNNILSQLVKGKLLTRLGTGTYQLNPYLFGKGSWKDVQELRMKVTYNLSGKTFKTEVDRVNNSYSQSPPESIDSQEVSIIRRPIKLSPEEKQLLELML